MGDKHYVPTQIKGIVETVKTMRPTDAELADVMFYSIVYSKLDTLCLLNHLNPNLYPSHTGLA